MRKAQGSMEYLLIIGGAALIVLLVIVVLFSLEENTEQEVEDTFDVFTGVINNLTGGSESAGTSPIEECAGSLCIGETEQRL